MARKNFCDRCGKEIKPHMLFRPNGKPYDVAMEYIFQRWGYGRKRWELCYDCAKAVREFLNTQDDFDIVGKDDFEDEDEDEDEYP